MDALTPVEIVPTEEQELIIAKANSSANLQIEAFAGTGKTATLKMMAREIKGPKLYVAFNKRVIEEALEDFPAECKTINSIGWAASRKTIAGSCTVDTKKNANIFKAVVAQYHGEDRFEAWELYGEILDTVALAKAAGYVPPFYRSRARPLVGDEFWGNGSNATTLQREIVDKILAHSIKLCYGGSFDFDDQVYFPVIFGGSFPSFPTVFVDEEQDLNAVNHKMIQKLTRRGRLISVGDPFQSIYAFRGAVQGGMALNKERFAMEGATLSVSFRCKSAIVQNARWRVPNFRWSKTGGRVLVRHSMGYGEIPLHSAIICRNNAPLFRLALNLLSNGRPCRVAGSDVGPKLVHTLKRLDKDTSIPRSAVLGRIDTWEGAKENRRDMADCMRVFAEASATLREAIIRAEHVLKQDGPIHLLTGHKAKGLEWDVVFHLDPWLIKDSEGDQELNLRYVIQTRAKEEYNEIDSKSFTP